MAELLSELGICSAADRCDGTAWLRRQSSNGGAPLLRDARAVVCCGPAGLCKPQRPVPSSNSTCLPAGAPA
jgi:hypothetical protein